MNKWNAIFLIAFTYNFALPNINIQFSLALRVNPAFLSSWPKLLINICFIITHTLDVGSYSRDCRNTNKAQYEILFITSGHECEFGRTMDRSIMLLLPDYTGNWRTKTPTLTWTTRQHRLESIPSHGCWFQNYNEKRVQIWTGISLGVKKSTKVFFA